MPAVSAIYAGEIGNSLEVEILARSAFKNTAPDLTMYPYGGERTAARNNAARLADKAQWKNFIKYYYQAYDFALGR